MLQGYVGVLLEKGLIRPYFWGEYVVRGVG